MACSTLCIYGESGTGKSTSLRNLDPETTFIISTTGKPLPFRGWKRNYIPFTINKEAKSVSGNYYISSNSEQILKILKLINTKMPHISTVVIDDAQYIMSYEFVDRSTEVGYSKFSEIAQHMMDILRYSEKMRDDCTICFLTHSENVGTEIDPKYVIKTIGKLLQEKVTLEGLFTYIFFSSVEEGEDGKMEYKLITNNNGKCLAKTPMDMFKELEIDNDLAKILEVIKEYNEE
jgi:ABC-type dipeptide/oligopeptide/nickel transport system ATPase component